MNFKLDKSKPICPQIVSYLSSVIASGEISPGEKVLSVREVALKFGVNPNTVQKSYEQLQMLGLIHSVRGTGWFVSDNVSGARDSTLKMANDRTREYFAEMKNLGFNSDEIKKFAEEYKDE